VSLDIKHYKIYSPYFNVLRMGKAHVTLPNKV